MHAWHQIVILPSLLLLKHRRAPETSIGQWLSDSLRLMRVSVKTKGFSFFMSAGPVF